jgi:hypothetical protein
MIFDSDDLYEGHDRLDLLFRLRAINPLFRMTAFAIPSKCPRAYLNRLPDWIEVVPHGWLHGDPGSDGGECRDWTYDQMVQVIDQLEKNPRWKRGFKAPGWIISDECYEALEDSDWWVADQPYNDDRRPEGLRVHRLGDGDHIHCHIQNVCGNGLEETWDYLVERVTNAKSFELISEVVQPFVRVMA